MKKLLVLALALAPAVAFADDAKQAEAVEKVLVAVEPKLHRCWEQAAAADYRVEGTVELKVVVGAGGRASRVEVQGNSLGKKQLEECALRAFADASFGNAFAPGDAIEVPVTFKAEANVTLKRDDAPTLQLKGTQANARILVDAKTSAATKASLTFVEIQAGSRWMRPTGQGTAVIYVLKGRAKTPVGAVTMGDVVVLDDGSVQPFNASLRTEMLVLLVPPGGEQAYREGAGIPQAPSGAAARVFKAGSSAYPTPDGKGVVKLLVEKEKASVSWMQIPAGATIPEHTHAGVAEIVYVEQGKGTMTVDGTKYPVEPFMGIHVPEGARHGFTADSPTEVVIFYAPSGPEQRFKSK